MTDTNTVHPKKKYRDLDRLMGKKRINVTLTAEEYALLKLKSEMAGESPTVYLKKTAMLKLAGKQHLNDAELDHLRQYLIEVRRIGNNINQIAHGGHIGFTLNSDEIRYQLRYLDDLVHTAFGKKPLFDFLTPGKNNTAQATYMAKADENK
jgi:hypothetical protein